MWEVLGIARTTDKTAIRRAYAAKLRTIDSDRDPASFVKIREAYEAALAWSSRPKSRLRTVADRAVPRAEGSPAAVELLAEMLRPQPLQLPPPQPVQIDEDARDFADFERAIADKRTLDAQRCLHRLMARGLIGIGLEQLPKRRVAEIALNDFSLSPEIFAELVGNLGFSDVPARKDDASELRRQIGYRLAADNWFATLRHTAAKRPWGKARDDILIARLFVGRRRIGRLPGFKSGRLLKYLEEYQRHRPLSSSLLDAGRMAAVETKFKRAVRRRQRRDKVYLAFAYVVVAFLILDFLWVIIIGPWK